MPRNAAALYTSARPSAVICRAAFSAVVIPMTRRPVSLVQALANAATVCVFPAPAAAVRTDTMVWLVSSRTAASSCSSVSPEPSSARRAMPSLTRCGTCLLRLAEDALLEVDLARGRVPRLVRRPVDARPVPAGPQRRSRR